MDLKEIGAICRAYRMLMGLTLKEVAIDTGYSIESVSGFEHGRSKNAIILLWYLKNGLKSELLFKSPKCLLNSVYGLNQIEVILNE